MRRSPVLLTALLLALAPTAAASAGTTAPAPPPSFGSDSIRCTLADSRVGESSGLAVSTRDPARLWTHNDSGDTARLFALGPPRHGTCPTLGVLNLQGVDAFDIEDVAPGPHSSLWLADIGDNIGQRQRIVLDRVSEPGTVAGDTSVPAQRFRFSYPDAPHNAEALLVSPRTGQVVIVTKGSTGTPLVYEASGRPAAGTEPAPAEVRKLRAAGDLNAPGSGGTFEAITGGAVAPDGSVIVLRTYLDAYVYAVQGDDLVAALHTAPRRINLPSQQQGEGVAFAADGQSILLSSEGIDTPILTLRRESGDQSAVGRLVGGDRNRRPALIGGAAVVLVLGLLLLRARARRRNRY
jgi:hypothetical protein